MLDVPLGEEEDLLALLLLIGVVVEVVAANPDVELELTATETDPTSPVVVVVLPVPSLAEVLEAVALRIVLAGPSFSAPAVTPTGKYVTSAGPSVDVTSSVVLYPLSVWL